MAIHFIGVQCIAHRYFYSRSHGFNKLAAIRFFYDFCLLLSLNIEMLRPTPLVIERYGDHFRPANLFPAGKFQVVASMICRQTLFDR